MIVKAFRDYVVEVVVIQTSKPFIYKVCIRYIDTLTDGDKAEKQLLMEFIGACLSNIKGWRIKKELFLVGDGDTGKSQLKSLVEMLLGKGNFIGIDLKEIEARFGTGAVITITVMPNPTRNSGKNWQSTFQHHLLI